MVHQLVHGGGTHEKVREHTRPLTEVPIGGDDGRSLLVAFAQDFIEVILPEAHVTVRWRAPFLWSEAEERTECGY